VQTVSDAQFLSSLLGGQAVVTHTITAVCFDVGDTLIANRRPMRILLQDFFIEHDEILKRDAIAEALERGTGRIESRILLLSYRHLAPLVSLFRSCRKGVEGGETSSAPSQPPRSTSPSTSPESTGC